MKNFITSGLGTAYGHLQRILGLHSPLSETAGEILEEVLDKDARSGQQPPPSETFGAAPVDLSEFWQPTRSPRDENDCLTFDDLVAGERLCIDYRRRYFGVTPVKEGGDPVVGLALSGGGIRSATFSLGILQALSRQGCIPRIDYLSTVSGGSYIGSFFGALFVPPEHRGGAPRSAQVEKDVLERPLQAGPGLAAVKQLRESGRYLTPAGTSDAFFGAAIVLRNWMALQLVIGSVAFLLFWLVGLGDRCLTHPIASAHPAQGASRLCASFTAGLVQGLPQAMSPVLASSMMIAFLAMTAFGIGYWITKREWIPGPLPARIGSNGFFWFLVLFSLGMLTTVFVEPTSRGMVVNWRTSSLLATTSGVTALGAIIAFVAAEVRFGRVPRGPADDDPELLIEAEDRVRTWLSQAMANAMMASLAIAGLLLVDGLGRLIADSLAATLAAGQDTRPSTGVVDSVVRWSGEFWPALSAAAPVVLTVISHVGLRRADPNSFLARFSLNSPTTVSLMGFCLAGLWLSLWSAGAHFVGDAYESDRSLLILTAIVICAIIIVSICYSFINLSSLSTFYASRLQRAYIGASNPQRLFGSDLDYPGDRIPIETYFAASNRAPVHLINMTIAQTQVAKSNIVARDRKGKPMHLSPAGIVYEGDSPGELECLKPKVGEELPLANWVAISGAAASAAIGSGTSLGISILATMANVRLGYWWNRSSQRSRYKGVPLPASSDDTVQAYLLNELRGRFVGTSGKRWYLTDGGHFENTGVYALLQREIPYIIASDNGADPAYRFDDVVRLVNRAQHDLGLKIQFYTDADLDQKLGGDAALRICFGAYSDLARIPSKADILTPFAALAEITYASGRKGLLLIIKPRLTFGEPPEVLSYHGRAGDSSFPQQSTADQFFDEDQWEAYRRLGELIGDRLFQVPGLPKGWYPAAALQVRRTSAPGPELDVLAKAAVCAPTDL